MKLFGGTGVLGGMDRSKGYTIIEVMIFLVVSAGLLVSVLGVISGQQQKTRFQTGVRDFESQLQDMINDVETGYYPNTEGNAGEGGTTGSSAKTYIGKGIQFYRSLPEATAPVTSYREMTIQGNAKTTEPEPKDITSLAEAAPTAFPPAVDHELLNGVALTKIGYGTAGDQSFGFAVVSGISSDGKKSSGSKGVIARIGIGTSDNSEASLVNAIAAVPTNANNGVFFCLSEGSGGRVAVVSLGVVPDFSTGGRQSNGQNNISAIYFDDVARDNFGCTS